MLRQLFTALVDTIANFQERLDALHQVQHLQSELILFITCCATSTPAGFS